MSDPAPGLPSRWLVDHLHLLRPGGLVLDVACGRGRHALFLARQGFRVHAIDRNAEAIRALTETARAEGLDITTEVVDLETSPSPDLGDARYDAVVVFNYLHRPLFTTLRAAVAPAGLLIYETFTLAQRERGRPTNPAFLLQPGELPRLVAPLVVVDAMEGDVDDRAVAAVVAERPASG